MNHRDEFEETLGSQPMRRIPADWRDDILSAANAAAMQSTPARSPALPLTLLQRLSTVLWPHPAAWAGLAAVWVVVLGLSWAGRDPAAEPLAHEESPQPQEWREALQERERLYADLLGSGHPEADKPRPPATKPRSERRRDGTVGELESWNTIEGLTGLTEEENGNRQTGSDFAEGTSYG
jgi:hypothetical protein